MTVVLLVEGTTDKRVISILLESFRRWKRANVSAVFRVKKRSDLLDGLKVASVVRYDLLPQVSNLSKVLVCVDMECEDSGDLQERVRAAQSDVSSQGLGIDVRWHLVRFALESWLIADGFAWQKAFPFTIQGVVPATLLNECDPKTAIRGYLLTFGFRFNYTVHDEKVAKFVDLANATTASPNLGDFFGHLT